MKRRLLPAILAVALIAGCAPLTPSQQYNTIRQLETANAVFASTERVLTASIKSGAIKPADVAPYAPAINSVRASLDQADKDAAAGNVTGAQMGVDAAAAAMVQLAPLLNKAKGQ